MNKTMLVGMLGCNYAMALLLTAMAGSSWQQRLAGAVAMLLVATLVDTRWLTAKLPAHWQKDAQGVEHAGLVLKHGLAAAVCACVAFL